MGGDSCFGTETVSKAQLPSSDAWAPIDHLFISFFSVWLLRNAFSLYLPPPVKNDQEVFMRAHIHAYTCPPLWHVTL